MHTVRSTKISWFTRQIFSILLPRAGDAGSETLMTKGGLRNALYAGLLFAGAYWTSIGGAALGAKAPKESHTYANGSELALPGCLYCTSSVSLRIGDGCVGINGALGWGGFFFNLKRKMTAAGPVFRVGHRTVTNFPDEVILSVGLISGVP
jgi:hypothetical protein